jgi:hypothetical protein
MCGSKLIKNNIKIPVTKSRYREGSNDIYEITYENTVDVKCSNPECPYRETNRNGNLQPSNNKYPGSIDHYSFHSSNC